MSSRSLAKSRRSAKSFSLGLEALEDRSVPATFAEAGTALNLNLLANERVSIVANASTYTLSLTGGTWSGTDSANVTGNGTATLTVSAAGIAAFTDVAVTDAGAGTGVTFNNSGANLYSETFTITLDNGSNGISIAGRTRFSGTADLFATADSSININNEVSAVGASNNLTFTTTGAGNNVAYGGAGFSNALGGTVTVDSSAAITGVGSGDDIRARFVVLDAVDGIGTAADPLEMSTTSVTADNSSSGGVFLSIASNSGFQATSASVANDAGTGVVRIAKLGGTTLTVTRATTVEGDVTISTNGANLSLAGVEAGGASHDVVASTGGAGTLTVANVVASRLVSLTAGSAIVDDGNTATAVVAPSTALTASTGIGSLAAPLDTNVDNLEATTTTGGVFVSEANALTIGGVNATLTGVNVTGASGEIQIVATGALIVNEGVQAPGDVTLRTAAGADLTTAAGVGGVGSSNGTLTLDAGRDLLLGTASNFGDVTGRVLTLSASRDIIASNSTFAQGGTGVTATAGGDITIQGNALINSTGAGAPVSLTTGVGGVLTINNSISGRGSATSVGGLLTVTADDVVLTSGGLDSSGTVTVRPVSAGWTINLGTNVVGSLSLTDAELDRITAGTLVVGRNDATAAGTITVSANLTLTTNLTLVTGAGVAGSSSITTGAATPTTLTVRQGGTSTFDGVLGGPGANENNFNFTFDGPGTLTLTGTNTYTGATTINGGTLAVPTLASGGTASGIGASTNAATNLVFDGGTLRYTGAGSVLTDRAFTLNAGGGTIEVLNGATTLVVGGGGTGAGGLIKGGAGILTLTGTSNYAGGTTVSTGTFRIGNGVANGSVTENILNNAALQFNNPTNSTFTGDISGTGSLLKLGTSTLTLTGTHTYTGTTTINSGTLLVNGSTDAASAVSVNNTGTLGGSGTVAGPVSVASGGTISPGNSPGILNTGEVSHVAGSNFAVEVNGDTPGTQYDQLVVTGTVTLGGANLVTSGTIAIPNANTIVLIDNDDIDAVSGTFAGLAEGDLVTINGIDFRISYVGGTGNDVVLTNTVASNVAFSTQPPNSVVAGATFGTAVTVTNSFGDPVPGQSVTLTLTGSGTLTGVLTATTDSSGVATFSGLSLDLIGTKTLTATAGAVTEPSNPITVTADSATTVAFLTQPPNSILIGNTFGTVVAVQDVFGNPVSGQSVTLSLNGTGTLFGTLTVISDSGGNATFTGLSVDTAGIKTLTATAGAATGTSNSITVTTAPNQNAQSTYATGEGPGGPGTVTVYNPDATVKTTINPFGNGTGARPITADINGDGITDTVVATGPGVRVQVAVVDGKTGAVTMFDAFEATFTGGGFVAAGDLDGDGKAEIAVSADTTGSARVTIFNGSGTVLADFFGIDDPDFRGGARVALGDVNNDGFADLVVAAGTGGGPRIAIYDGQAVAGTFAGQPQRLVPDFFAFEPTLRNGAYVSAGDVNGDGFADLIFGGGPDGGPRVLIWDAATLVNSGTVKLLADFFAADPALRTGGVRVAAKDLDGDTLADVVVGVSTDTSSTVAAYLGNTISPGGPPPVFTEIDPEFPGVFVG